MGREVGVETRRRLSRFISGCARLALSGNPAYWAWVGFLLVLIVSGALAYFNQLRVGLALTAMRDQVSWGFYIGNFTFLVGVAAAAVVLVIPAYVYDWKPIREIVIFGELLAISAIVMCLLFVTVDIGRPERFWHLIPPLGRLNFPRSILAWDMIVLNLYLLVNLVVVVHILFRAFSGRDYEKRLVVPLVLVSIPMAIGIHTVTAFLYNGLAARPYWNASILAPQFLASAFSSGPAILLAVLQLLRKFTRFEIRDEAIWKIAELMAYAIFINLFLHGAEAFKEYYSHTEHLLYTRYWFQGIGDHRTLVPYAWSAVALNLLALGLFIVPRYYIHHQATTPGSAEDRAWIEREDKARTIILMPAMALVWVLGLMLAVHLNLWGQYWFSAKLLLVIILSGYNGWIGAYGKKLAKGHREVDDKKLRLMNELPGILTAFIVVLVIVRPF